MSNSFRKGVTSERKVGEALVALQGEDLLREQHGIRILHIKHGRPHSDLQRRHVDYLVMIEMVKDSEQFPVPIQVKSSERYRREFEWRMDKAGLNHLGCVAVRFGDDIDKVKAKIIQCLKTAVDMFNQGLGKLFNGFRGFFEKHGDSDAEALRRLKRELRKGLRRHRKYYNWAPIHQGGWSGARSCPA
jgi:hypothetical protein